MYIYFLFVQYTIKFIYNKYSCTYSTKLCYYYKKINTYNDNQHTEFNKIKTIMNHDQ